MQIFNRSLTFATSARESVVILHALVTAAASDAGMTVAVSGSDVASTVHRASSITAAPLTTCIHTIHSYLVPCTATRPRSEDWSLCGYLNSTQLKFINNCSLKAGLNEHRTHHNYKNTKLHIARLNRDTNTKKQKKTQWSSLIIFGSIGYITIAKSRGACIFLH